MIEFGRAAAEAIRVLRESSDEEITASIEELVAEHPRVRELAGPIAGAALALQARETPPITGWLAKGRHQDCRLEARLLAVELPEGARRAVGADVEASWGELRIYVGGQLLTTHRRSGHEHTSVRWFLLPFFEWLVREWTTLLGPPLEATEVDRRPPEPPTGIPLPFIETRRWVHTLELTARRRWLHEPEALFMPEERPVRLDPSSTAQTIKTWLAELAVAVHDRAPSPRTEALVEQVHTLATFERRTTQRVTAAPLQPAVRRAVDQFGQRMSHLLAPVRDRPAPLRLAFGAASPHVSSDDVGRMIALAEEAESHRPPATEAMSRARESVPLRAEIAPWRHGQELAYRARTSLQLADDEIVDLDEVFHRLGVPRRSISLDDTEIRGVVMGYPRSAAMVVTNRNCSRNRRVEGRRFTLAHELCHVLYDHGVTRTIGVLDGPWAPLEIEQRANAFAAMFLMPPELVRVTAATLDTPVRLAALAHALKTSPSATREHLRNLARLGAVDLEELELDHQAVEDDWVPDFSSA